MNVLRLAIDSSGQTVIVNSIILLTRFYVFEGFNDLRPAYSPLPEPGTRRDEDRVLAARADDESVNGYLVDAFEKRGDVERRPDPADRGAALVVITDRGREEIAAARRLIAEIERGVGRPNRL